MLSGYVSGNKLTDVKGLEKLTQLTKLTLSGNQLTDVKGLEKLTQLKNLFLGGNQLTDVKGLEKLTQLTWLGLAFNPDLPKKQIDELKKALPKCNISLPVVPVGRTVRWTINAGSKRRIDLIYWGKPSENVKKAFGEPDAMEGMYWVYNGVKVINIAGGGQFTTVLFGIKDGKVVEVKAR